MDVTVRAPLLTAAFWRSRRSAAIAGDRLWGAAAGGAGISTSLMRRSPGRASAEVYAFGRSNLRSLFSVYAMRMAAVFALAVSTIGIRTSAVPRWVSYLGYLVGLILLVAAGAYQWTQLVFPAWVLLFSLVIFFDRPLSHDSHPPRGR